MKKLLLASSLLLTCIYAYAGLEPLTNSDLQQIDGQAGADINLDLRLNQTTPGTLDTNLCEDSKLQFCRLGFSVNNRYDDSSQDTYDVNGNRIPSTTGRKLWLVFKGIQGSINVQQMALDSANVTYSGTSKPAFQLGFNPLKPIQIRNLGFTALSIETDTVVKEDAGNIPGYLALGSGGTGAGTYIAGKYSNTTNKFDLGRETGFTGLNINGNLSIAGTIKIFSCDSNHPRC